MQLTRWSPCNISFVRLPEVSPLAKEGHFWFTLPLMTRKVISHACARQSQHMGAVQFQFHGMMFDFMSIIG